MNSSELASLLLPTAVGAVGGGALSAHLTSRSNRRNEDPDTKRRRVLRNALMGSALGSGVGAMVPGMQLLHAGYSGAKPSALSSAADSTLGFAAGNLAGLGVAGAGAYGLARNHGNASQKAMETLAARLYPEIAGEDAAGQKLKALTADAASGESLQKRVFAHLKNMRAHGNATPESLMNEGYVINSYLRAGGNKGVPLKEMLAEMLGADPAAMDASMAKSLQAHLGKEGPVSRSVGKLMDKPKFNLPGAIERRLPDAIKSRIPSTLQVAQKYHEKINPVAWRQFGRIPTLAAAAGIVPAALIASRMQRQLTGQ